MKLVGLSEQEASDWAYLASEVINWEWMLQILKAAEWGGTPQEAVEGGCRSGYTNAGQRN